MKKISLFALFVILTGFLTQSCDKDLFEKFLDKNKDTWTKDSLNNHHKIKVVKDCTGSYLQDLSTNLDYRVCNVELLKDFSDGTPVYADFKKISACASQDSLLVCMMYHKNEGWIEVLKIRK